MGVFSVNNMLQENFTSQPVLPLQNSNESYYSLSLEYCKLINEEYDEANKIFYRSLVEAGDNYTVINDVLYLGICVGLKIMTDEILEQCNHNEKHKIKITKNTLLSEIINK